MRNVLRLLIWLLGTAPAAAQNCLTDFIQVGTAAPAAPGPPGCYQITSKTAPHSNGGIWSPGRLRLDQDVDLSFTVTQCGLADGLAFVLQQAEPSSVVNGDGATLGYYQTPSTSSPALGIELDLYSNAGAPYNDPPYPHAALALNHDPAPVVGPVQVAALGDCSPRVFRVQWDHSAQQLRVLLAGQLLLTYSQDLVTRVFGGNPVVYFGWVGTTGDATATQVVCPGALTGTLSPLIASGPASFCAGSGGQAELRVTPQPAGTTYQWSPATGLTTTSGPRVVATPTRSTTYSVLVTYPSGCERRDSVRVEVQPVATAEKSAYQIVCAGTSVLLYARSPDLRLTHTWTADHDFTAVVGDTVRVRPASRTRYTVTTAGPGYCSRQDTVSIGVRPALPVQVSAQPATRPGEAAQLTATSSIAGLTYHWDPAAGLNTQSGAQVQANPALPTTYTVTASNASGCQARASVEVRPYYNLQLPNIITPNGDQLNDTFQVPGAPEPVALQVYSRWGRLVFEQADYRSRWGGEGLTAGTYYYYLRMSGERHWQGWVEVVH